MCISTITKRFLVPDFRSTFFGHLLSDKHLCDCRLSGTRSQSIHRVCLPHWFPSNAWLLVYSFGSLKFSVNSQSAGRRLSLASIVAMHVAGFSRVRAVYAWCTCQTAAWLPGFFCLSCLIVLFCAGLDDLPLIANQSTRQKFIRLSLPASLETKVDLAKWGPNFQTWTQKEWETLQKI